MKIKFILKVFPFLLILIIASCNHNYNGKSHCSTDQGEIKNDEDLDLNFNCKNTTHFQHLHIDLVNQFGVLGKVSMKPNMSIIDSMKIRLKEVGSCRKYKLDHVKYAGTLPIDSIPPYRKIHFYKVEINKNPGGIESPDLNAHTDINVNPNDIIDIHIVSDDLKIKSHLDTTQTIVPNISTLEELITAMEEKDEIFRRRSNYGTRFCRSKIILQQ